MNGPMAPEHHVREVFRILRRYEHSGMVDAAEAEQSILARLATLDDEYVAFVTAFDRFMVATQRFARGAISVEDLDAATAVVLDARSHYSRSKNRLVNLTHGT